MCATRYEVAMTLTLSPAAVILSSPPALIGVTRASPGSRVHSSAFGCCSCSRRLSYPQAAAHSAGLSVISGQSRAAPSSVWGWGGLLRQRLTCVRRGASANPTQWCASFRVGA